jgi:quercetin dioxygenase-like cupin family protein
MNDVRAFIESGILEMYVTGSASPAEMQEVERMAAVYPEVDEHILEIAKALETYALANAIEPHPTMKPFVMATIDYSERMAAGEEPVFPPALDENSSCAEYAEYLHGETMQVGPDFGGIGARIIGYTPTLTTAVVCLADVEIQEVHTKEIEKFLILEGSCTIIIEDNVHHLIAGDFLVIPVNKQHLVKITGKAPCKALLQRVAC